jgi:thiol:disulfide interchange protein DsbD
LLALRAGGAQLGWGAQLQSPAFVFAMASFLLIFALNLSGLFEVGLSATGVGASLQMKEGYIGSFFTGALAVLVATPCSAPFLAPALGAAFSSSFSAAQSLAIFTAIGLGLSTPYLLLSIFPQAIKFLPRPGAWMETFKQLMAFPLYATVGWLLWVLAGQTKDDDNALLLIAFGFVFVAMATWLYGRFGQAWGKPGKQLFGRVAAALVLVAGLYIGWPKEAAAAPASPGEYQVTWEKWSPEAITAAQAAGKFVYVDFTARWCATCQTNKAAVFHSDEILGELKKKNVLLLRGDWTNRDPKITAELARWNRSAVPFNLIYAPTKPEPVVLPELLTAGKVVDALAEAAKN